MLKRLTTSLKRLFESRGGSRVAIGRPVGGLERSCRNLPFASMCKTLKSSAAVLDAAEIPFLLGWSFACWARGGRQPRHDIDLLVYPEDGERALAALEGAGFIAERAPEAWLLKARDGNVLVDLIYGPVGLDTRKTMERFDELNVLAMRMRVMKLEDILVTKLLMLQERWLDYESILEHSRSLREQVDWPEVRARTSHSPFAKAFFTLVEELGILARDGSTGETGSVAPPGEAS